MFCTISTLLTMLIESDALIITTLLHYHLGTAKSIKDDIAYNFIPKEYQNFMIYTAFVLLTC